jgi:hypothetical protein
MNLGKIYTPAIRIGLAAAIVISIGLMYYVNVVQKDFIIFTNEGTENASE